MSWRLFFLLLVFCLGRFLLLLEQRDRTGAEIRFAGGVALYSLPDHLLEPAVQPRVIAAVDGVAGDAEPGPAHDEVFEVGTGRPRFAIDRKEQDVTHANVECVLDMR